MAGPCRGLKVIDLTTVVAGPMCGRILADLGADVVKLESLDGDMLRLFPPIHRGMSAYFLQMNRNKRSIAMDLKSAQGRKLARQLAAGADIFIENLRPGVAARLGLDHASLQGENPRLIYASINGVGFVWESYDKVWPAMDGALGAHIRAQIAKAGLHAFERQWDNGYRQMTSSTRPIKGPDDLKGFKIRVPPSPLWTSMFKAFDAAPMSINFSETYSALQTKVAEGQENPLSIIFFAKLFEVQKYLSETNHMWDGFWFLANAKAWNALPADVRDVISKNLNKSAVDQRADIFKQNETFKADLTSKGMEFIKVDPKPFRDKLQTAGFYKEWKGKYGDEAWSVLEKFTGPIS